MSEQKGMLAELKEDAFMSGAEIVMPDIIKMVKPFVKPAHKQLAFELGADDKMFIIRKVLNGMDVITKTDGEVLKAQIVQFEENNIVYLGENQDPVVLSKDLIKDIELSEYNLAQQLTAKIAELKQINQFHKDIVPLEKKRNLLGTVCFYVLATSKIKSFEVEGVEVEFPIAEPEQLITGLITGDLWKVDKTL